MPQPSGTMGGGWRVTRLVILPDFQGLGVGSRFLDTIADMYVKRGLKLYIRTAHIKLGHYLSKNPKWRTTARNGKKGAFSNGRINCVKTDQSLHSVNRDCYSFEYVGEDFLTKPHKEIVVDSLKRIDMDAMKRYLAGLKQLNYLTVVHNGVHSASALNVLCREMGIRTELLYIRGEVSKKHLGDMKIVSFDANGKPRFRKVS